MIYRVAIDAGHGGCDPGEVFEDRREKDDALRLALAVGERLENAGVLVLYSREGDTYATSDQRAAKINRAGADLFLSLHRGGARPSGEPAGAASFVYSDSGPAGTLARAVNAGLAGLGFRDLGVKERPDLTLLRQSAVPAVLTEAGSAFSPEDNGRFDAQFEEIAGSVAESVLRTLDAAGGSPLPVRYRVQSGAFSSRISAEDLADELEDLGFPAEVIRGGDGIFRVLTGSYERLDNAAHMEKRMRGAGCHTLLITES